MNEETELLILRYISGELSVDEIIQLKNIIAKDDSARKLADEYLQIQQGIIQYERQQVKTDIAAMLATIPPQDIKDYKSSFAKSNFIHKIWSWIKSILTLFLIASIISVVLIYAGYFPIKNKYTAIIAKKLQHIEEYVPKETIITDTVFHTIYTSDPALKNADTIVVYENELHGKTPLEAIKEKAQSK